MSTHLQDTIIILDKPKNICSNRAIQKIKSHFNLKKIGHAGTLDNFAEGILIVLTGKATKLSSLFLESDKSYLAELEFGTETDTLDRHGNITLKKNIPASIDQYFLRSQFQGDMIQTPPKYSAIHINGQRASELARKGEDIKMPPRKITIYDFNIVEINLPKMIFTCRVSKGSYVRALARDIAYSLDSCAHLTALQRTSHGTFLISNAIELSTLLEFNTLNEVRTGLLSLHDYLNTHNKVNRVVIEDTSIRQSLQYGIQPIHLLKPNAKIETHFEYIYLVDQIGPLGLWKLNETQIKLLYHY